MGQYVARRLLQFIPVFFGATFAIYALVFAIPGDPIRALFGDRRPPASTIATLRDRYNLDDPLPVQYGKYMVNLARGDFGESFRGREVSDIIAESFPVTVRLAVTAVAIIAVVSLIAGTIAALRRGSFLDSLILVSTILLLAPPLFVLGYTSQLLFGVELGLLPIAGVRDGWQSYILPACVIAAGELAFATRLLRTSLVENLRADYVRTAVAKGLSRRRVVGRHALRNSLISFVTFVGADLGTLMAGAIVTEGIFNLPGIGRQAFLALQQQENVVVVGIVTVLVIVFIVANLVVDLLYAMLDPRIRYD